MFEKYKITAAIITYLTWFHLVIMYLFTIVIYSPLSANCHAGHLTALIVERSVCVHELFSYIEV